jgi:hypothetical protein
MSTFNTAYDDPALAGEAIAHDRSRQLLGQVMGYVAATVGFAGLDPVRPRPEAEFGAPAGPAADRRRHRRRT